MSGNFVMRCKKIQSQKVIRALIQRSTINNHLFSNSVEILDPTTKHVSDRPAEGPGMAMSWALLGGLREACVRGAEQAEFAEGAEVAGGPN